MYTEKCTQSSFFLSCFHRTPKMFSSILSLNCSMQIVFSLSCRALFSTAQQRYKLLQHMAQLCLGKTVLMCFCFLSSNSSLEPFTSGSKPSSFYVKNIRHISLPFLLVFGNANAFVEETGLSLRLMQTIGRSYFNTHR